MVDLYGLVLDWQQIGVFDVLLPFVLVFSISFGLFTKIRLFGENNKINIIVSFVLALLFLQNDILIVRLQAFLPQISFAIIAVLMGLLLISVFSPKSSTAWGDKAGWVAIIISVIILVSALSRDPTSPYESRSIWEWIADFWYGLSPGAQSLIIFLGVILILMMFLGGGNNSAGGKIWGGLKGAIEDIFKGPGSGGKH